MLKFFLTILVALSLSSCEESRFYLADESRLPIWFEIPEGKTRSDVSVSLHYYVYPNGREAKFRLKDSKGWTMEKVKGKQKGLHPIKTKDTVNGRPSFEIVTVNGMTEVIVHRERNNIFHMYDGNTDEIYSNVRE